MFKMFIKIEIKVGRYSMNLCYSISMENQNSKH